MAASMIQSTGSADVPTKAVLLAETVLSTPVLGSDAAIISACAQLDTLEHEYCEVSLANDEDPRLDSIFDAQVPLVSLIGCTAATTAEGVRAKARSLALMDAHLMRSGPGDAGEVLTGSILRDLLGGQVRDLTISADPDAAIHAACANVRRLRRLRDADPELADAPYRELMVQHREALLETVRLPPTTPGGMASIAMLILEERDHTTGDGKLKVELFVHDLSERAAEAWLEALAVPGVPITDPDAEVIAVSEQIIGTEAEWAAVSLHENTLPLAQWHAYEANVRNPLAARSSELFNRLLEMQPTTPAGQQAAARALLAFMPCHDDGTPDIDINHVGEKLAWKLVGQLAGRADAVMAGLAQSTPA